MVESIWPLCLSVKPCQIEQKSPRTNTEHCHLSPTIQNGSETILPMDYGL